MKSFKQFIEKPKYKLSGKQQKRIGKFCRKGAGGECLTVGGQHVATAITGRASRTGHHQARKIHIHSPSEPKHEPLHTAVKKNIQSTLKGLMRQRAKGQRISAKQGSGKYAAGLHQPWKMVGPPPKQGPLKSDMSFVN